MLVYRISEGCSSARYDRMVRAGLLLDGNGRYSARGSILEAVNLMSFGSASGSRRNLGVTHD